LLGMAASMLGGGGQQQSSGGLGNLLGMAASVLGGRHQQQAQQPAQAQQTGPDWGALLGQLTGAVAQGAQMKGDNGKADAGALSTSAVLNGILGAFLKR
jgi:hypothetical protein